MTSQREGLLASGRRRPAVRVIAVGGSVVLWLFTAAVLGALAACMVAPRLTGAMPYTVLTGSMAPAIEPGAVVVVRPEPFERIGVGDVVTYQARSDDPTTVTHRVVGVIYSDADGRRLITRGDANGADDPDPVQEVQVRGTVWYAVPWVGRLARYGDPAIRAGLVTAAGWTLIAYAVLSLLLGIARVSRQPRSIGRKTAPCGDDDVRGRGAPDGAFIDERVLR